MVPLDDGAPEYVPLEAHREGRVEHIIAIRDGDGDIIFALQSDGSVYLPDPERVEESAALFWRAVEEMAEMRGWTVRRSL